MPTTLRGGSAIRRAQGAATASGGAGIVWTVLLLSISCVEGCVPAAASAMGDDVPAGDQVVRAHSVSRPIAGGAVRLGAVH